MKNKPTNQTPPEKLFDPNQYGNWLTGEPKATWGAGRDTSLPKRKYSKKAELIHT